MTATTLEPVALIPGQLSTTADALPPIRGRFYEFNGANKLLLALGVASLLVFGLVTVAKVGAFVSSAGQQIEECNQLFDRFVAAELAHDLDGAASVFPSSTDKAELERVMTGFSQMFAHHPELIQGYQGRHMTSCNFAIENGVERLELEGDGQYADGSTRTVTTNYVKLDGAWRLTRVNFSL